MYTYLFYQTLGIVHLRIHAEDEEGYNLINRHWEECLDFIQLVRENETCKLLVHCVAGINRSGLISCAAYMIMENKKVLDAAEHCIEKRGIILTNKSFQKELCLFAKKQRLLDMKPEGFSDKPIETTDIPPPPIIKAFDRLLR